LWKLFLVIALNKIRALGEYHRASKRDVGQTTNFSSLDPAVAADGGSDETAYRVLRMTIDDLFGELPEVQRKMVVLRIEGHDIKHIAASTQRAKRSVERALQEFRQRLASALNEE
jgi:DNA-directed RNA polymerase specialized sigma24 family protein